MPRQFLQVTMQFLVGSQLPSGPYDGAGDRDQARGHFVPYPPPHANGTPSPPSNEETLSPWLMDPPS